MALQITAIALVLAITFLHSIWGLYSGLINAFCSVLALVISFGFFEALNDWLTGSLSIHPGYTKAVLIVALYAGSLALLRAAADQLIRGNVHVPMQVDWVGGALCGFLIAQISVGVLVLGVLALPIGGTVLGFTRYERLEGERDEEHGELTRFARRSLWTRPDDFAVGLFDMLSAGSLSGVTRFRDVYPDFADAVFYANNTVQPESSPAPFRDKKSGDGFKNGLRVQAWWNVQGQLQGRYRKEAPSADNGQPPLTDIKFEPAPNHKVIAARLLLDRSSADRDKLRAVHHFRTTMIRVVGDENGQPRQYIPRLLQGADTRLGPDVMRIVDPDNNFSLEANSDVVIDAYFEVGEAFTPRFFEYRAHARAAPSGPAAQGPPGALTVASAAGSAANQAQAANLFYGQVLTFGSGVNNEVPFELSIPAIRRAPELEVRNDSIAKGRIHGSLDRYLKQGDEPATKRLNEPEGFRIVQLRYSPKKALTLVGDIFNFVGQLNQYYIVDDRGTKHLLSGYWALVPRGSGLYLELYYAGEKQPPDYNGMLNFQEIDRQELNEDATQFCMLFLVPRGVKIVRFENQVGEGQELDYTVQ